MFRLAARSLVQRSAVAARPASLAMAAPKASVSAFRLYSASALSAEDIKARISEVLTSFEKVDPSAVSAEASFAKLGLDSLDAVEVVMAIEEEFAIEIPDEEADRITTVGEAISYISNSPEAH